ncbi:Chromo domain/shadow [Penicillium verhagenii]|uniref:Chromo domain/shadow n=1 Tax=Penicillium verhagenii TaxID=1562060 RepID=UPI002544D57C|nr:Chromo domain/shadow [Penicillium verhagenii]KAJ5928908.1 Chromo domain/shadow [Penicillium verhagenii]
MPPLPDPEDASDEESGDVPFSTANEDAKAENGEEDSEGDDDDEEGVYVVESISTHAFLDDGTLSLHVKWKGYEKKEDMTWEPEGNLVDGARDVLMAYYKKIGGKPAKPSASTAAKPGRKRKSLGEAKATPVADTKPENKRQRKSTAPTDAPETPASIEEKQDSEEPTDWLPKGKNWENEVAVVETITRDEKSNGLFVLLNWKNGKTARVSIETCYERLPRKMLRFYEDHLHFKE